VCTTSSTGQAHPAGNTLRVGLLGTGTPKSLARHALTGTLQTCAGSAPTPESTTAVPTAQRADGARAGAGQEHTQAAGAWLVCPPGRAVSQLLEGVDGECSKWALKSDRQ
jgi:hypothetical protein